MAETFLKLTLPTKQSILINVAQIASIQIWSAMNTGTVLGTEISLAVTNGGGSHTEGIELEPQQIRVKESFEDVVANIGNRVDIIHVTPVNIEKEADRG